MAPRTSSHAIIRWGDITAHVQVSKSRRKREPFDGWLYLEYEDMYGDENQVTIYETRIEAPDLETAKCLIAEAIEQHAESLKKATFALDWNP